MISGHGLCLCASNIVTQGWEAGTLYVLRGIIIIIFFVSEPILFLPLSLLQKRGEREEGTAEKLPGVGKGERRNMCCWVMWLYHVTGESGPAAAAAAARPRRRQTLDAGLVGRSDGRQAGRLGGSHPRRLLPLALPA